MGPARGDRGRGHHGKRSAWVCVVGGACIAAAAACQKDPVVTDRAVTLHAPQSCAPGLANLDDGAFAVYDALGDYEPMPAADGHLLKTVGTPLPEIDAAVRTLLVDATEDDREWQGSTPIAGSGPVDVFILPARTPCALRGAVVAPAGATIGMTGDQQMLFVGGAAGAGPEAVSLRLDTGAVTPLTLPGKRTGATVTAFGTGALLAGGTSAGVVMGDAVVYAANAFEPQAIALSGPRANAGAVGLATGETLLVGGVGGDGTTLLDTMEIVDPVTRKAHPVAGRLAVARRSPTVLRLASGEIFVAGGLDANGVSVAMLEWFSPDASQTSKRSQTLVESASARSFVALQAGGVLAVIAPPQGAPTTFQNTWVIDPDGLPEAAKSVEGTLTRPVLFGGAGGAPVLWTGSAAPDRWARRVAGCSGSRGPAPSARSRCSTTRRVASWGLPRRPIPAPASGSTPRIRTRRSSPRYASTCAASTRRSRGRCCSPIRTTWRPIACRPTASSRSTRVRASS